MAFRFAQLTDSHLYARMPEPDRDHRDEVFRRIWHEAVSHGVELVVHTGDFVDGGQTAEQHRRFRDLCRSLAEETGVGFHVVRGNHDATVRMPDETYAEVWGEGTYLVRHKGWAFLGIDRYWQCYEHTQHAFAMSPETIDRVTELLAPLDRSTPLVVMLHDDPIGVSRFHRGPELMHRLEPYNVQLLLFGHVQATYLGRHHGIPFVTVTGDDHAHDTSPLNYNIVTCRDDGTAVCDVHPIRINTPRIACDDLPAAGPRVQPTDEWHSLRGPHGSRCTRQTLPDAAPRLAWKRRVPGGFGVGAPKLAEGKLIVTTLGHGRYEHCAVHALDAMTGQPIWRTPVDGCVEGGALIADDAVFCGTSAGTVYRLSLDAGELQWSWNNRDNMPIACEPTLDAETGTLHVGANWEMYALDAATGKRRWRSVATRNGFPYMGPGAASPIVVGHRVFHQRTFNASQENQGHLQSVLKDTGKELQLVPPQPRMHPMQRHASPVVSNGRVYFVTAGLFAVDPDRPDRAAWVAEHSPGSATPCVADDVAFVSYHDEVVAYGLSEKGATAHWAVPQEPAKYHFCDGREGKWGYESSLGALSSPLLAGGREGKVLLADLGGRLRCLDAVTGREDWRLTLPEPVLSAPILSGNTLWVCDYFGTVYALTW